MLFSVLIANYNNSRFLDTVLKSIFNQTYTTWEIILVDDGSTDHFEDIILPYLKDKRIKLIRNGKNEGCAYTKWVCAKHATGEIMAFVDPDDALVPDALEIMVESHKAHPLHSIIYSTHYVCDPDLHMQRISLKPRVLPENTPYLLLSDGSIHHFASFKKFCYDLSPGLTPERHFDKAVDQDLYYLLEEQGPVYFVNKPLYYYRIHSGSISNWGQEPEAMKSHLSVIEDACQRRISYYKSSLLSDAKYWLKTYRTRYYKTVILNSARRKQWIRFSKSLMMFPFVGGMKNVVSYFVKFPKQGISLLRKTFIESYQH